MDGLKDRFMSLDGKERRLEEGFLLKNGEDGE